MLLGWGGRRHPLLAAAELARAQLQGGALALRLFPWRAYCAADAAGPGGSLAGGVDTAFRGGGSSSNSSSSATPGEQPAVALLTTASIDVAELQRQEPQAFSQLVASPPLTAVLVAVSSGYKQLQPAELMRRVCLLGIEWGLQPAAIQRLWERDMRNLRFRVEVAQQRKQVVQQLLGISDEEWAAAVTSAPGLVHGSPDTLVGMVAWLQSEAIGLSRADVQRLWRTSPGTFCLAAQRLQGNLQALLRRCPLNKHQLRAFVLTEPNLLWRDSEALLAKLDRIMAALPGAEAHLAHILVHGGAAFGQGLDRLLDKISFLQEYGFSPLQLSKAVARNSILLTSTLEDKVQPVLQALEAVVGSREAVVQAVSIQPTLLGTAVSTIASNVEVMQGLGLSDGDIQQSVHTQPQLFVLDYTSEEMQSKLRYFDAVLGRSPRHMLVKQPWCLKSNLRGIDCKVAFMEYKGEDHYKNTLTWIADSSEKFCRRYGYDLAEFEGEEGRARWLESPRVAEYGLAKPPAKPFSRALAARDKGRRAKLAAKKLQAGDES